MEILDLYDDNFNKLNETIVRGSKPDKGKNIMLSVAYIVNKSNEYLIQKTSKEKGSKYSSTGGHVTHNEDGLSTIIRELKEELDIDTNSNKIKHITIFKYPNKSLIFNVYLLEIDNINNIKLQHEEVESIEWMNKDEIMKLINDNKFLESHAYIFNHYISK